MTPYETAITALADALETKLEVASDRLCDVEVDGRLVVLRPLGEAETSIMMFALVAGVPDDGTLSAAVKDRALSMSLFGTETHGGHLGLFGKSIILSAPAMEATGLAAESFAERLLAFSQFAGEVEKMLADAGSSSAEGEMADGAAPTSTPESEDFIKV